MGNIRISQPAAVAITLTIISLFLIVVGVYTGLKFTQLSTKLAVQAYGCPQIVDIRVDPNPPFSAGQDFTCYATLDSTVAEDRDVTNTIACGWSKNGGWPQNGGRWVGATCNGVDCQFGIRMDPALDSCSNYELVAFDYSTGCGPNAVGAKRIPLTVSGSCATSTIPPPTQPSPPAGGCGRACTQCILAKRPDILPFYQKNGWDVSCNNHDSIIDNWCIISPKDCPEEKSTCPDCVSFTKVANFNDSFNQAINLYSRNLLGVEKVSKFIQQISKQSEVQVKYCEIPCQL